MSSRSTLVAVGVDWAARRLRPRGIARRVGHRPIRQPLVTHHLDGPAANRVQHRSRHEAPAMGLIKRPGRHVSPDDVEYQSQHASLRAPVRDLFQEPLPIPQPRKTSSTCKERSIMPWVVDSHSAKPPASLSPQLATRSNPSRAGAERQSVQNSRTETGIRRRASSSSSPPYVASCERACNSMMSSWSSSLARRTTMLVGYLADGSGYLMGVAPEASSVG
jgi:hypothetical protein